MEDIANVLVPQTNRDVYSRTVNDAAVERGQMSYGAPTMGYGGK